MKIQGKL